MTCDHTHDCDIFRLPPGDSSLAGTMQEGRDFMLAVLRDVDLSGAGLYWTLFHEADLDGALMTGCDLRGAVLNRASLRGTNLQRADLGHDELGGTTDFVGADLTGADLRSARIGGANFTGARLIGADLRGARSGSALPDIVACFNGADLSGARLDGADLKGAIHDAATVFPRGFRPDRAGMVMRHVKSKMRWKDR